MSVMSQTMPVSNIYNGHVEASINPSSNDLNKLKEISENLKLTTRRPSVVQWKQIIEYRRSRGQYASKTKSEYLDNIVDESLSQASEQTDNKQTESNEGDIMMTSREFHAQMFQENENTPTKMTSSKRVAPTPIRRFRRNAQSAIPELRIDGNNNKDDVMTSLSSESVDAKEDRVNDEEKRYKNLSDSLEKLRSDLISMRMEDHKLARKLLNTRSEMNRLMTETKCEEHALMLDDVAYEFEEEMAVTSLIKACDLSDKKPSFLLSAFSPLRHIGVNRLNINARRFSIR